MRVAAEVKDFDPAGVVPPKEARRLERNVLFAVAAAQEAVADAGLNGFDPTRDGDRPRLGDRRRRRDCSTSPT